MARYPAVMESIAARWKPKVSRFFAYDGSLRAYPVICVVLFNPANGTCFASFGAHPSTNFGVALGSVRSDRATPGTRSERCDNVRHQRSMMKKSRSTLIWRPTSSTFQRLISRDLFKQDADYPFTDWDFSGTTEENSPLMKASLLLKIKKFTLPITSISAYTPVVLSLRDMRYLSLPKDLAGNNNMGSHLRETLSRPVALE